MKSSKGITLVALVITIIILLILAGITIAAMGGENGLFSNAQKSKVAQTKGEMAESLTLALQDLQLEKRGKASIDDITQEWVDSKLTEYTNMLTEDTENNSKQITMKKDGVTVSYVIDERLAITEVKPDISTVFEIEVTDPIISTNTNATKSDEAGKLTRGTTSYIKFSAELDVNGGTCTISPEVPCKVLGNGTYTFTITGTYEGVTKTKQVKVNVNQYEAPTGYVQYDAGEWTPEEIEQLKSKSLYDINISKTYGDGTYKLKSSTGLNFTFGGFSYKGDATNNESIDSGAIITNRNRSVDPDEEYGIQNYDGWQILETQTKTDESGNIIKNSDGTERKYVTKIMHAGSPENFVYYANTDDAYRAEYLLSNGKRQTGYNTLSDSTTINTRSWDMYRDKQLDKKGYIKEVHAMTEDEASALDMSMRITGANYWLASAGSQSGLWSVNYAGYFSYNSESYCLGIRPVVTFESGVYIASGEGTAESPYVLGKE